MDAVGLLGVAGQLLPLPSLLRLLLLLLALLRLGSLGLPRCRDLGLGGDRAADFFNILEHVPEELVVGQPEERLLEHRRGELVDVVLLRDLLALLEQVGQEELEGLLDEGRDEVGQLADILVLLDDLLDLGLRRARLTVGKCG